VSFADEVAYDDLEAYGRGGDRGNLPLGLENVGLEAYG